MKKTLCFDFGNTRLKAALFEDDILREDISIPEGTPEVIQQLLDKYRPENSILSSVIDHDIALEEILASATRFHKLSHTTRANFTTPVGRPDTIGADRLALCAAAVHFYPGRHNLVIGLGSCITYNFITQYHEFIGGAISPGLAMRFKAMHVFTAKLPEVSADWNYPLIGYDTKTNMQSGVINGMVYEIDGFIDAYAAKYGNFNVVLTGGDSAYFAGQLKNRIFADSNFLFKGLYALSETNNG